MGCVMTIELGAYVLHALEQDETDVVERHLDGCASCQEELRQLEFTASLLSMLSTEDLDRLETAVADDEPTDDGVPPPPGRRLRALLPLATAALAAVTALVPWAAEDHEPPPAATVVRASDPTTDVRAAVSLDREQDGTRLHLSLSGAYPDGWCSLVARSRDGRRDTAATWRADDHGTAEVAGTTAIPADRLSELDVLTDTGAVLVAIPIPRHDT